MRILQKTYGLASSQDTSKILIEELPAYAPQLNPEEYCHGNVKQRLKNAFPESKEEIRSVLNRGFARLRHRPDSLIGFFTQLDFQLDNLG